MTEGWALFMLSAAALIALAMLLAAGLAAWRDWLDLQRMAIAAPARLDSANATYPATALIEVADLRERIRKLEAIAAGIYP